MNTITVKSIQTEVKALQVNITLDEQGNALVDNGQTFVPATDELKNHLEEITELVGPSQKPQVISKSQIKIQSGIILNNGNWIVKDESKNAVVFLTEEEFKAQFDYQAPEQPEPAPAEEAPAEEAPGV
jgi:hypothetical protein